MQGHVGVLGDPLSHRMMTYEKIVEGSGDEGESTDKSTIVSGKT